MAVIISNGNQNISAASGFYRVEAHNLMPASGTVLALTSARQIAVTFANAGNCQGIGLYLQCAVVANDRSIVVTLQENVATVWTDRAAVTLTAAQIKAVTSTLDYFEDLIVPFTGGTFPYAVDTTAGKWRFNIVQSGGTTGTWNLETSDATNPTYFTWCDNALSYSSGDTLICKDVVTVNQSTTLGSVLSTGVTTVAIACVVCRGSDPSVANLTWENPPASSYTLTINGAIIISARGGWRVGTSASRIPYAQQAIVTWGTPTSGTYAGIIGYRGGVSGRNMRQTRQSIWMYGEIPTYMHTTLAADAATGQKNLTTTDSTGWQVGDVIAIGRQDAIAIGEGTAYTINTIAGTAIGTVANIATNTRKAGGQVVNLSRYGVKVTMLSTGGQWQMGNPANLVFSGCIIGDGTGAFDVYLRPSTPYDGVTSVTAEDGAWTAAWLFDSCAMRIRNNTTFLYQASPPAAPEKGLTIQGCIVHAGLMHSDVWPIEIASGAITVQSNIYLAQTANQAPWQLPTSCRNAVISGNIYENGNHPWIVQGVGATIQNNTFWGVAAYTPTVDTGALRIGTLINGTLGGNAFNKCAVGLGLGRALSVGCTMASDTFGTVQANTIDVDFAPGAGVYFDILMTSPGTFAPSVTYLPRVTNGSILRATNFAGTANRDQDWLPYGYIVRTGDSLSDTTVRTSGTGKFALRFQPTSGTNLLKWTQTVPTGAISTKTMTISCWVYISTSAYAAGTHTKPQLAVIYDNATTVTATAAATYGAWQQLAVTFTPATSYGQLTVTVQGATDAAGSNAYFYVDDFNVAYPAGVQVDLGGLDLWANGLPVTPTIATFPALGGVWDEALTAHTVSGSFGAFVKKLLTVAKFIGLK